MQKIVGMQSYLTGSVQDWSCVITTGEEDCDQNPWCFQWSTWLADFRVVFCMQDLEQDTLTRIGQLQQGSKSITDCCMAFVELKGKLGKVNADSQYVRDCF